MWWGIGFLIVGVLFLILIWGMLALGARNDEQIRKASIRMMQERAKYDLSGTTTSGSPVKLPLDK